VEVADEFEEVGLCFHHDGLVPVLEAVAAPLVPAVAGAGVAREEGPHAPGERARARPHQAVGVVGEEGPGAAGPGALLRPAGEAGDAVRAIRVVLEDGPPLEAAHPDMVQGVRGIEAGLAGHGERRSNTPCCTWQRPVLPVPYSGGKRSSIFSICPMVRPPEEGGDVEASV
jgi:hypothetical protein